MEIKLKDIKILTILNIICSTLFEIVAIFLLNFENIEYSCYVIITILNASLILLWILIYIIVKFLSSLQIRDKNS